VPSPEADRLVERAIAGDADAFAALFRATLPIVHRNLFGRCGDTALAEDLTSDTYMRAMRAIGTFEGTSRDFLAWVLRIGRNRFLDHVRSGRVRWEVVVDEMPLVTATGDDPEEGAVTSVEGAEVRRALEELTPEQQEVVQLRFLEGLPVADVARIVGRNEGAVKALQFRALRSLGRVLTERGLIEVPEDDDA
jgi:RNA polymerase sigma-70 factor (ECF subfamily)